jgi:hypothetical protein
LKFGAFLPTTSGVWKNQDSLVAPADNYICIYLSARTGPPHPGSTAQQVTLYTYLTLLIHRIQMAAPTPASASPWST